MSLTVEVVRDSGDVNGPQMTCSYFSSASVFRQIGRVQIDKAAKGLKLVTMTLPGMRRFIRPGKIILIVDEGREYRAKVKSILFSVGRNADGVPFATCSLTLRMIEVS